MSKNSILNVDGKQISIAQVNNEDYISITDMAKSRDEEIVIAKWLSQKNTIEFLGAWESLSNPDFNYTEFGIIKNESGGNNYTLSVKRWVETTNAIGLFAKAGRYGGTYAHKDIAFEFGSWISPVFKLYLIKEFQRLKEQENNINNLEWSVRRVLSKANYHIQTLAVKEYRIPQENIPQDKQGLNARDIASVNELTVLSSMESMNSVMIRSGMLKYERGIELRRIALQQIKALNDVNIEKSYKTMLGISQEPRKIENKAPKISPLKKAQEIVNPELSTFNKALTQALDYNFKTKDPE